MGDEEPTEHLPLLDAVMRWCDPSLVETARQLERRSSWHDMEQSGLPQMLRPDEHDLFDRMDGSPLAALQNAWSAIERDFRRRIERSELYLEGVRAPEAEDAESEQAEAISGTWAAVLRFDFAANSLWRHPVRYVALTVSRKPSPWRPLEVGQRRASPRPLRPAEVPDLDDETILALLEEHARRVVESDALPVLDPGITKVSFMPIMLRKMSERARSREMFDTLAAEAAELERWIQGKAPSHQTPTAGAIENALRNEYRRLKP